jgi:membrane protease YdiL (CAAX protease family)
MANTHLYTIPPIRWFVLGLIVLGFSVPTLLYLFAESLDNGIPSYWSWLIGALGFQLAFLMVSLVFIRWNKLNTKALFGRPALYDAGVAVEFSFINIALTYVVLYALYFPLSYSADYQGWVVSLLLEAPSIILFDGNHFPIFANLVSFVSIVVFAPLIEEFVFRGVIYARLNQKYTVWFAVFVSSLLFGLLHGEVFSAALFGALLCYSYQKSGRLIVPIIIHSLNNLTVWLVMAWDAMVHGKPTLYSLTQFQSEWRYGLYAAFAISVWAIYCLARKSTLFPLPATNTSYSVSSSQQTEIV